MPAFNELLPKGEEGSVGVTVTGAGGVATGGGALGGAGLVITAGGALGFGGSGVASPTGSVGPFNCANAAVADIAPQHSTAIKVLLWRMARISNNGLWFLFIIICEWTPPCHGKAARIFTLPVC